MLMSTRRTHTDTHAHAPQIEHYMVGCCLMIMSTCRTHTDTHAHAQQIEHYLVGCCLMQ